MAIPFFSDTLEDMLGIGDSEKEQQARYKEGLMTQASSAEEANRIYKEWLDKALETLRSSQTDAMGALSGGTDKTIAYLKESLDKVIAAQQGGTKQALEAQRDALDKAIAAQQGGADKAIGVQRESLANALEAQRTGLVSGLTAQVGLAGAGDTTARQMLQAAQAEKTPYSLARLSALQALPVLQKLSGVKAYRVPSTLSQTDYMAGQPDFNAILQRAISGDTGVPGTAGSVTAAAPGAMALEEFDPEFSFRDSPLYQFRRQQAEEAGNRALRAQGFFGTETGAAAIGKDQERIAAEEAENQYNRVLGLVNLGIGGEAEAGDMPANAGANLSSQYSNLGANIGNVFNNAANQRSGLYQNAGSNMASTYGSTGTALSNLHGTAGTNLSNLYEQAGTNLANVQGATGTNIANAYGQQGINTANQITAGGRDLSNLLLGAGNTLAGNQAQLGALYGGINAAGFTPVNSNNLLTVAAKLYGIYDGLGGGGGGNVASASSGGSSPAGIDYTGFPASQIPTVSKAPVSYSAYNPYPWLQGRY